MTRHRHGIVQGPTLNQQRQRQQLEAARERLRAERLRRQAGGDLDRLASLILTTMYSSEHIEVALRIPTTDARGRDAKPAVRLAARQQAITTATNAYAARRITRDPNVLYSVSTTPDQQLDGASEINFDTVAVAVMDGILWVARNFKMRAMTNTAAGRLQPAADYTFGRLPNRTLNNIMTQLRAALHDGTLGITAVHFLEIRPTPTTEVEASQPHAEMQLVHYFTTRVAELRLGVSKGICPSCQDVLRTRGARFTHDRLHGRPPQHWVPPSTITVGIEARHRI